MAEKKSDARGATEEAAAQAAAVAAALKAEEQAGLRELAQALEVNAARVHSYDPKQWAELMGRAAEAWEKADEPEKAKIARQVIERGSAAASSGA